MCEVSKSFNFFPIFCEKISDARITAKFQFNIVIAQEYVRFRSLCEWGIRGFLLWNRSLDECIDCNHTSDKFNEYRIINCSANATDGDVEDVPIEDFSSLQNAKRWLNFGDQCIHSWFRSIFWFSTEAYKTCSDERFTNIQSMYSCAMLNTFFTILLTSLHLRRMRRMFEIAATGKNDVTQPDVCHDLAAN